jgi:hypothetical protein
MGKLENVKQIGEGEFAKVYSATWIYGSIKCIKRGNGSWLNDSQNMSTEYFI